MDGGWPTRFGDHGPGWFQLNCPKCDRWETIYSDCRRGGPPNDCACPEITGVRPPGLPDDPDGVSVHGPRIYSDAELRAGVRTASGNHVECWNLLREPERVFADKTRWPTHLCWEMAWESTELWARRVAPTSPMPERDWEVPRRAREMENGGWEAVEARARAEAQYDNESNVADQRAVEDRAFLEGERPRMSFRGPWPLPVGESGTAPADLQRPFGGRTYGEDYRVLWQPLRGEKYCCLALRMEVANTVVEMFGLCEVREGWGSGVPANASYRARGHARQPAAFALGAGQAPLPAPLYSKFVNTPIVVVLREMVFRVTGDPSAGDVVELVKNAEAWWKRLREAWKGEGGRHALEQSDSGWYELAEKAERQYAARRGRVTWHAIAGSLGVSRSQLFEWRRRLKRLREARLENPD